MEKDNTPGPKGRLMLGLGLAAGLLAGWTVLRRRRAIHRPSTLSFAKYESRTALITGASSGIGAAFARELAAKGYNLILVARRQERLAALATGLEADYRITAEVLATDLSDPADVDWVEQRIAELDDLDILINNAGFGAPGQFAQLDLARQLDMINLHIIASVRLTYAALPGMVARGRGAVINVSSVAGFVPVPGSATYSATKAYLNVFSEALQAELKGTGVVVQALCPGFTHTGFHDTPDHEGFDQSQIPELMWMTPEDVAAGSLDALGRSPVIYIPGLKNRLVAILARNTPPWLLQAVRYRSRQ